MKTRLFLASLATATAMAFALPALAADSAQDFVNKAAAGGMFEVDSSKVAEGKVQDQSVKDFAHKMIDDHGAANAKLETIAGEQKLTVPKELDAKLKGDVDTLQNGKDPIDAPYVQMQRDAHTDAVKLFESYAKDGDNAELKTFAQAKGRIQDAGFADVSKLTKDDQGIWRGQANKDGKNTTVALDYKGNVVAGTN